MSWTEADHPTCDEHVEESCLLTVVEGRARDLGGGFTVRRILPSTARRAVGPVIFFDHFGPMTLEPPHAMDVRPHPHIGLATVTYLFDGAVMHRDSLGTDQEIQPGAINWMTAGRGIVHSERTPERLRDHAFELHGLQLWIGLPCEHEETEPAFYHHPADSIPSVEGEGFRARVLVGSAFGQTSPVQPLSTMYYVDLEVDAGARIPISDGYAERSLYVVSGTVTCEGTQYGTGNLLAFRAGGDPKLVADTDARVVLCGGDPLEGPRHMFWNLVSSDPIRLEQAKLDWAEERFPEIPDDHNERIPLPKEEAHLVLFESDEKDEFRIYQHGRQLGELTWTWPEPNVMDITHTGVHEELRGQGWARRLVLRGVAHAKAKGAKIIPTCSYARKVLTGDDAYTGLLA